MVLGSKDDFLRLFDRISVLFFLFSYAFTRTDKVLHQLIRLRQYDYLTPRPYFTNQYVKVITQSLHVP